MVDTNNNETSMVGQYFKSSFERYQSINDKYFGGISCMRKGKRSIF
jgi:hypothetical protein